MENAKRATGVDLIKALCMIGLPIVHVTEQLVYYEMCGFNSSWMIALTALGPAVFLICMGFDLGSNGTPKQLVRMGFQMLVIGLILNVFRFVLPGIVAIMAGSEMATWKVLIAALLSSDIYFAVGLFYFLLAGFKKLKLSDLTSLLITVVLLSINTVITGLFQNQIPYDFENILVCFLGNFIYINESSYFPIISWAIYPMVGIILAKGFKDRMTDNKKIGQVVAVSVVGLLALYTSLWFFDVDLLMITVNPANGYITEIFNALIQIGLALLAIFVLQMIINTTKENAVEHYLKRLSVYLMPYYFIHWIVVQLSLLIVAIITGVSVLSLPITIALIIFVMVISILLSKKFGFRLMRGLLSLSGSRRKKKE